MGEIVVKVLCKEDLDDAAKKLRDQLLDKMEVSVLYTALCCDKETTDSLNHSIPNHFVSCYHYWFLPEFHLSTSLCVHVYFYLLAA